MKKSLLVLALLSLVLASCDSSSFRRVKGNGQIETEDRQISRAERIRVSGGFDVELVQGSTPALKIEGDENLLPLIVTREEGDVLVIEIKDHVNLSSTQDLKLYITTPKLVSFQLSGSGDVTGKGKFTGADKIELGISGSGNISLELNTPQLNAEISGSGDMELRGETERQLIRISGSGNYKAEDLKSEDTKVSIAGSGDVRVYADITLDVNIAGAGSVYYRGDASVRRQVIGGGEIEKLP